MSGWNSTIIDCYNTTNCSHNESGISSSNTNRGGIQLDDMIDLMPGSIAFVLCTFVLLVLFKSGEARECAGHVLLANAAFGDLFGVIVLSFQHWVYAYPMKMTASNIAICKVYYFFFVFQHAWTGWASAALAYDRYDMVARPLNRILTVKKAKLCIVGIFAFCALWASFPLIGWSEYRLQRYGYCSIAYTVDIPEEIGSAMYTLLYFTFNYVAPLIIDVICFIGVLITTLAHIRRKKTLQYRNGASRSRSASSKSNSDDNQAVSSSSPLAIIVSRPFIVVATTIASNVLLTAPYLCILVLRKFGVISWQVYVGDAQIVGFGRSLTAYNHLFNAVLYVIFVKTYIVSAFPCLKRYEIRAERKLRSVRSAATGRKTNDQSAATAANEAISLDVFN